MVFPGTNETFTDAQQETIRTAWFGVDGQSQNGITDFFAIAPDTTVAMRHTDPFDNHLETLKNVAFVSALFHVAPCVIDGASPELVGYFHRGIWQGFGVPLEPYWTEVETNKTPLQGGELFQRE